MEAEENQGFDWVVWDKMLEETHTEEKYHKLIQPLPDYPRPENQIIKRESNGGWERDGKELKGLVSNAEESSHTTGVVGSSSGTSRPSTPRPLVAESKDRVIFYHGTKDAIEKGFDLNHPNRKDND